MSMIQSKIREVTRVFSGTHSKQIDKTQVGGKAWSLWRLAQSGFAVPPAFFIPPEIEAPDARALQRAVEALGGFPVAVRSSARLEDLAQHSFAGLYESYLNIEDLDTLIEKIARCRSSAEDFRVSTYMKESGLDPSRNRITVVVQQMVRARRAGVLFTLHPHTGREDEMLLEWCEGLADQLVSGHTQPHSEIVTRSHQPKFFLLGLKIQALMRHPQDIEWAEDEAGTVWCVQSRDITSIRYRRDVDEQTNADFRDGGVSARVCTPLMYSLYREVMQRTMPEALTELRLLPRKAPSRQWIGFYYGRPYWNMGAVKSALEALPGYDEEKFDRDLGIRRDYGARGPIKTGFSLRVVLGALPTLFALHREFRQRPRAARDQIERFLAREVDLRRTVASLAQRNDKEFRQIALEVIDDIYLPTEREYFRVIYANSNAQSEFKSFLRKLEGVLKRKIDAIQFMGDLGNVSHLRVQKRLEEYLTAAQNDSESLRDRFIDEFYFHGPSELDLTVPRWGEDDQPIREMVEQYRRHGVPAARTETVSFSGLNANALRLHEELKSKGYHLLRWQFLVHARRVRRFLSLREEAREISSKCYALLRLLFLEMGRRWHEHGWLTSPNQIFFMDVTEILKWLKDAPGDLVNIQNEIEIREMMYEGYRRFLAPGEFGGRIVALPATDALNGIPGSQGVVIARARVIADIEHIGKIQPGEVLVTAFTDPGWTPIFGLIQGIVTEVGGVLSHAAVISREFGIPAVLAVPQATCKIKTGDLIEIDADLGTVRILESKENASGEFESARQQTLDHL